jgi:2-oxoisovalerate dehydrogenase E2 component (dihydrolipoyl transacylase)
VAKVTMPQLGESVAEGTIGKWLKQPGDHVAKYEPLVEVVTDKVNAEVPSPFEGILREILAEEGSVVPNNAEIAVIETADDGAGTTSAASKPGPHRHRRRVEGCHQRPSPRPSRSRPSRPVRGSDERSSLRPRPPRRPVAQALHGRPSRRRPRPRMTPAVRRLRANTT